MASKKVSRQLCIQEPQIFASLVLLYRERLVLCRLVLAYACHLPAHLRTGSTSADLELVLVLLVGLSLLGRKQCVVERCPDVQLAALEARKVILKVEVEHRPGYPPTINNAERARFAIDVAAGVCGEAGVNDSVRPSMGAEDFSYMLERVPGAMVWLGNGGGREAVSLHNSRYDFNDMAIPFGVSFFVRTVERFLGDGKIE